MEKKLEKIKVVALDCDGVMFDSSAANRSYYNEILNHFSMPELTDEQFAFAHMQTVYEALAHLFSDEKMLKQAHLYRRQLTYFPFIKKLQKDPHLHELIETLKPSYRVAIATNRTDTMKQVLTTHELDGCFEYVVTAADVEHAKPHPEPLLKIVNHFHIMSHEMLYVGDSLVDEVASKKAGVVFTACNNKDLTADFHITGLKELLFLFK